MEIHLLQLLDLCYSEAASMKTVLRFALAVAVLTALIACGGGTGGEIPIGDTGITITSVVTVDRFPPDCEQGSPMCTMAEEGSQYLVIWLDRGESSDSLPGAPYVTDSSGTRYDLGSGLASGRYFLAQKLPKRASDFTLHVPGVEPIALER